MANVFLRLLTMGAFAASVLQQAARRGGLRGRLAGLLLPSRQESSPWAVRPKSSSLGWLQVAFLLPTEAPVRDLREAAGGEAWLCHG